MKRLIWNKRIESLRTSTIVRSALTVGPLLLGGCSFEGVAEDERVQGVEQALGQADVFGFEAPTSDWSSSSGVLESSTVASAGSRSLGVRNVGYAQINSVPLTTLSGVSDEISVDVRVPATPGWGSLALQLNAPSVGLWSQWIGQVSLAGLAPGSFHRLTFSVPANVRTALAGSYSDLVVQLILNVPTSSSPYLIDNLSFGGTPPPTDCSTGSPFTLVVTGEETLDPEFVENMRCTFFTVYPDLVARFNPSAPTTVGMHFVEEDTYPAWAIGSDTYYSIPYMVSSPLGTDVVTHEIMHVIQGGYVSDVPGWYIEGSADYVRDVYGLRNVEAGWSIPSGYGPGQHYRQGYGETAAFFQWIDATYRQNQAPVVDAIDDLARAGTYSTNTWQNLTGYDIQTLWSQYSNGQAPLPATSGVRFFQHSDYQGEASYLGVGSYDVSDLIARGVLNDWVSSIQIPSGYTVTIYEHGGFGGNSASYTSDVTFWHGDGWNDQVSSVVITN